MEQALGFLEPTSYQVAGLERSCEKKIVTHSYALCTIHRMNPYSRIVSESELRRNTGEHGTRKYIAYKGIVYDVTDCPKWRNELHEQLHFAGQDLTFEFPEAPHQEEVFIRPCIKVVGALSSAGQ